MLFEAVSTKLFTQFLSHFVIQTGININEIDKRLREAEVAEHGLGVITAAIFLAGEMAGSGVLALPGAMVGTGTKTDLSRNFE